MNPARWFNATCHHCRCVLLATERIRNAELDRLREHVRQLHSQVALAPDADAGVILGYFTVELAP